MNWSKFSKNNTSLLDTLIIGKDISNGDIYIGFFTESSDEFVFRGDNISFDSWCFLPADRIEYRLINTQPERSKREDILEIEAPEIPQCLLQSYEEDCKFMEQFSGVNDDLKNDAVL